MGSSPAPRADVEAAFVRAFVVPGKQERLLDLLSRPKRRGSVLQTLYHFGDLDPRFARPVPPLEQTPEGVERRLRELGAPEACYLLSDVPGLDARTMPLGAALEEVVGAGGGTLLSCIPGSLGYFEGEEPGDRWLLHRPKAGPGSSGA